MSNLKTQNTYIAVEPASNHAVHRSVHLNNEKKKNGERVSRTGREKTSDNNTKGRSGKPKYEQIMLGVSRTRIQGTQHGMLRSGICRYGSMYVDVTGPPEDHVWGTVSGTILNTD